MSRKRYPVRIPRSVSGIRAQETRSGPGRSWWARRWTEIVEGMGLGSRLGRGKNYAVSGQIVAMEIDGNSVCAKVVGTRPDPYDVTVTFRTPEDAARRRIVARLKAEPMLVARLLVDELPLEVEEIFRDEGCDLFPGGKLGPGRYDMTTKCTCPDYANPCKHSSAVLVILGEEVARRPSVLVELRGIPMEELCDEG